MQDFISHFSAKPAFTVDEARIFLHNRRASNGYYRLVIHNLLKSGRIFRITKGAYTFHNEAQFVGFAFNPFYYGLEDALSLHGLWEQETNPVIITPRDVRTGIRQFEGRNFLIRHIDRSMFFGYSYQQYGDFYIPVSTVEKTLIDFAYFKIKLRKDVIEKIIERIDLEFLRDLLGEIPTPLKLKVKKILHRSMSSIDLNL